MPQVRGPRRNAGALPASPGSWGEAVWSRREPRPEQGRREAADNVPAVAARAGQGRAGLAAPGSGDAPRAGPAAGGGGSVRNPRPPGSAAAPPRAVPGEPVPHRGGTQVTKQCGGTAGRRRGGAGALAGAGRCGGRGIPAGRAFVAPSSPRVGVSPFPGSGQREEGSDWS